MYKLYITLLLEIFKVANAMIGSDNSGISLVASSSNPEPYDILPLTLISSNGHYTAPNRLQVEKWIIGTNPTSGQIEFTTNFRGDQIFLCKMKQMHPDASSSTFSNDNHCLYPVKFDKSNSLRCIVEPEPYISKLKTKPSPIMNKDVSCGSWSKRGKIYRLVYQICITEEPIDVKNMLFGHILPNENDIVKRFEFEIYRFCIDERDKTVMYTEHKILSPELLDHPQLQQERQKEYEMTIEENNPFNLHKESLKTQYENERKIMSESQAYLEEIFPGHGQPLFKAQKFVPPEDFAFALWRKATFNYMNGKRMNFELVDIWERICKLIRTDAIENKREYYIYTSVFELLPPNPVEKLPATNADELPTNPTDELSTILTQNLPQTQEPQTNQAQGESSKQPYEMRIYFWLKKIYYLADEEVGKENANKETKAIAIMVDNNFDKNEYYEAQLNLRCGTNTCENAFVKRFPETGKFVRCCSLINNRILQGIDGIEINKDLELNLKEKEDYSYEHDFSHDNLMDIGLDVELDLDLLHNYLQ